MIKAIIFDFDGVIGDTYDINFEVTKMFISNLTKQDFIDYHKGNFWERSGLVLKPEESLIFFEKQKERFTARHLFPLWGILTELKRDYQLFIISSTADESIEYYLKIGNYDHFFKQILGSTTHKSKVKKIKMVLNQYNLKPEESLFITDTTGDIIEAREANVKAIGVTWGYHKEELLLTQKPLAIVHSPKELQRFIDGLRDME